MILVMDLSGRRRNSAMESKGWSVLVLLFSFDDCFSFLSDLLSFAAAPALPRYRAAFCCYLLSSAACAARQIVRQDLMIYVHISTRFCARAAPACVCSMKKALFAAARALCCLLARMPRARARAAAGRYICTLEYIFLHVQLLPLLHYCQYRCQRSSIFI